MQSEKFMPSGVTAKEKDMNAIAKGAASVQASVLAIAAVTILATTIVFLAGHAQSSTLHDAAHDMRHATGFPCH